MSFSCPRRLTFITAVCRLPVAPHVGVPLMLAGATFPSQAASLRFPFALSAGAARLTLISLVRGISADAAREICPRLYLTRVWFHIIPSVLCETPASSVLHAVCYGHPLCFHNECDGIFRVTEMFLKTLTVTQRNRSLLSYFVIILRTVRWNQCRVYIRRQVVILNTFAVTRRRKKEKKNNRLVCSEFLCF